MMPALSPSLFLIICILCHIVNAEICLMYLTGQHNVVPEARDVKEITHVALAFMRSSTFNSPNVTEWPLFTTVQEVRPKFPKGTAIMVAIGGWGDTGFSEAAATESSRKLFAQNVKAMVEQTGADGVDIDWEYPGGNGEDYKQIPNADKAWEIEAYPKLLAEIRSALGPSKLISAAVPGLRRDMLAFTAETVPKISASLDFFNIMTYDLMNRRDNVTKHHSGAQLSLEGIDAYLDYGVAPEKANFGLGFYVKWFKTRPGVDCSTHPVGCPTELMEDPVTGADLGQAGGFSWHDPVPEEVKDSFQRAIFGGKYDSEGGGFYFWDTEENMFWSFDTPYSINEKFQLVFQTRNLGGVFAWGLGEDAPGFYHLRATTTAFKDAVAGRKKERCRRTGDGCPSGKRWKKEEL